VRDRAAIEARPIACDGGWFVERARTTDAELPSS